MKYLTPKEVEEKFDEEFIRDDGLLEKYDAPDIKTFLLQSHIQSLQKLHDEVGEMKKDLWQPKPFPKGKEGILDDETAKITFQNVREMKDNREEIGYNSALKDIQNKLTKEIEVLQALMK